MNNARGGGMDDLNASVRSDGRRGPSGATDERSTGGGPDGRPAG